MQLSFAVDPHVIDMAALDAAGRATTIAIDTETQTRWQGIGPERDHGLSYSADVIVISLAWMEGQELKSAALYAPDGEWPQAVCDWLIAGFQSSKLWVFHNSVFDARQLSKLTGGVIPESIHDTQTIERLLNPDTDKSYALANVAAGYGLKVAHKDVKAQRGQLHTLPVDQLLDYAKADAALTLQVYSRQQELIQDTSTFVLYDWENRATREYCRMTAAGIKLNAEYVRQRIVELSETLQAAAARLREDGLNAPNSPQARVRYIYETKGLPKPDRNNPRHEIFFTPKGGLSSGADVLDALIAEYPDHADKLTDLITYLECSRISATLTGLLEHAATDGRIHSLVAINTQAGRRSASHPQVQNWKMAAGHDDPVGDMCGVAVGGGENFTLVEIDYSNAENWMAAMLSGDDNLAAACAAEDFHSAMAQQYFGQQWEQADKDERKHLRRMGKTITFGTAYGMGPKKLALSLGIAYDQAVKLLAAKDAAFWGVAQTKKLAEDKAISSGFINLWTGRKVPVSASQTYTAWNYLNQGGVAEMVKRSIVLISETFRERGMASRVALDMHDAIILEVEHTEWDAALAIASDIMQTVIPAEMNRRTNPPIQWIAQANLEENRKKWGKFQWHPGLDDKQDEPAPVPALPTFEPAPEPASIPLIKLAYPDMDFTWQLRARPGVKFTDLTPKERGEWRAFFNAFWNKLDQECERTFEVVVPQNGALRRVSVNRVNYIKVLELWAAQPQIPAEVGLSSEAVKTELDTHQTFMKLVEKRVQGCLTWLQALEDEGHAEESK